MGLIKRNMGSDDYRKMKAKSHKQSKKASGDSAKAVATVATFAVNPALGLGLAALGGLGKKKRKRKKKGLF